MRIAAIYDIHGNLPALDAVLREIDTVHPDLIVVEGDVAAGPMPRETIERLRSLASRACFIRGNADRSLVDWYDSILADPSALPPARELTEWTARQLDPHHRDFLASFTQSAIFTVGGLGEVLFCHATPRSDEEIITVATPETRLRGIFAGVQQQIVVCGHTHMQFDRRVGDVRVVNAGSVGMPYGEPGAYWALLGPGVELRQTLYNLEEAAHLIRTSTYPEAQDFADHNVLQPPTAAEALTVFERMAE